MISFRCGSCDHKYKVPDKYSGKKVRCKKCNSFLRILSSVDSPSEPSTNLEEPSPILLQESPVEPSNFNSNPDDEFDSITRARQALRYETARARQTLGYEKQMGNNPSQSDSVAYDHEEILSEIERLEAKSHSWGKNLIFLVISLLIFFQLGVLRNGVGSIIIIIVVLFIHETGHFIAMRIFHYRNVKMFFIPLIGAAVSGENQNVPSYKKAIVTLMGPLPGMIIGVLLLFVSAIGKTPALLKLSAIFLLINGFNLLPFFPLDGGRFLNEILFSRNRYIELCFRLFASISLLLLGYFLHFWILAVFGLLNLITLPVHFKLSGISKVLRQSYPSYDSTAFDSGGVVSARHLYTEIINRIAGRFSTRLKVKIIAVYTKEVLERFRIHPPGLLPTFGLLSLYLFACFIPIGAFVGTLKVASSKNNAFAQRSIVEYHDPNALNREKEQVYVLGKLSYEIDLSEDGKLYHGRSFSYYPNGNVSREAHWFGGKWHGNHKEFDKDGKVKCITVYDKGKFVVRKELNGGRWVEKQWDELPIFLKKAINIHNEGPPLGPGFERKLNN